MIDVTTVPSPPTTAPVIDPGPQEQPREQTASVTWVDAGDIYTDPTAFLDTVRGQIEAAEHHASGVGATGRVEVMVTCVIHRGKR